MVIEGNLFVELGVIIIIAAVIAYVLRLIKQPQILSYILAGVLLTPVLHLVTNLAIIESMSTIGIAFLLFLVGLEMDIKSLKNVSFVSSLGGIIQVAVLFIVGYLVALLLGFLTLEAAYIGLVVAFSSTMIVLKLLSDKKKLNTLHGRIVIGILLVQDIIAILALSILNSLNDFSIQLFGVAFVKFIALFGLAFIASKYIFPKVFRFAAKHQELLLISSLAVCFSFSLGFHYLGFSVAIGAFIAGITLGNLDYNIEIISKMKSLRDFFSLLFFVSLGMGLSLGVFKKFWVPLLILLFIVLIFKPIVIMTICSLFKYTRKPSFLVSNSLAQVGEFSLILAAQGLLLGHLSQDLFSLVVVVTLISIILTSYFIKYDNSIYKLLKKPLKIFDKFSTEGLEYFPSKVKPEIILCGQNRIGYSVLENLKKDKEKVLIIDFNPEIITRMAKEGYHCLYGDVTDEEIIERMDLKHISILISTVPGLQANLLLIKKVKQENKRAKVIVNASSIEDSLTLYKHGAHYVIMPHFLGGERGANLIGKLRKDTFNLKDEKKKHIQHLKNRQKVGHEHPTKN
jgi:Kef-type K+ transport system membrane component KefB/Trk K+ transport system NAD-binding subunit